MKTEPKFYIHKDTGLIFEAITSSGTADPLNICHALTELKPNTSEGATEKHLPVITKEGQHITVSVGSILHPMSAEHSITWISLYAAKAPGLASPQDTAYFRKISSVRFPGTY